MQYFQSEDKRLIVIIRGELGADFFKKRQALWNSKGVHFMLDVTFDFKMLTLSARSDDMMGCLGVIKDSFPEAQLINDGMRDGEHFRVQLSDNDATILRLSAVEL